ncbi:MAG TPA: hypothetical protein VJN96_03650 [Vicinamibacterales bacterium]|nr:hypothetical protein [Vicinamibacterales bacterium]
MARASRGRLLYGLEARDPLNIFLSAAVLVVVAGTAARWPARRAVQINPEDLRRWT